MDNDVREGWQLNDHLNQLTSDTKGFVKTRIELVKLNAAEKVGKWTSILVLIVVVAVLAGFTLLFASFALARWLAVYLESVAAGYLSVAGIYLVISILFILIWHYRLRDRITLNMINEFYTNDNEEHEETIRESE